MKSPQSDSNGSFLAKKKYLLALFFLLCSFRCRRARRTNLQAVSARATRQQFVHAIINSRHAGGSTQCTHPSLKHEVERKWRAEIVASQRCFDVKFCRQCGKFAYVVICTELEQSPQV